MLLYCYPPDCHHSVRGKPDFIQYLLVVVICKIYFTLLKLNSQYTLRHILQYHAFCNISSFTNFEQNFTKYPTYLDPFACILHLMVYIFLLNPCREKSFLLSVSVAIKTKPTNPYLSILPLNIVTTLTSLIYFSCSFPKNNISFFLTIF